MECRDLKDREEISGGRWDAVVFYLFLVLSTADRISASTVFQSDRQQQVLCNRSDRFSPGGSREQTREPLFVLSPRLILLSFGDLRVSASCDHIGRTLGKSNFLFRPRRAPTNGAEPGDPGGRLPAASAVMWQPSAAAASKSWSHRLNSQLAEQTPDCRARPPGSCLPAPRLRPLLLFFKTSSWILMQHGPEELRVLFQ